MQEIIFLLLEKGWQPAGRTSEETVRLPTKDAPLTDGTKGGGKLVTFGGRRRFILPGTPRICTVGKRTTCFYQLNDDRKPADFITLATADVGAVERAAAAQ